MLPSRVRRTLVRAAALLSIALASNAGTGSDLAAVSAPPLEFTTLLLADMAPGGVIAATIVPRALLSFDWNVGRYRVVVPPDPTAPAGSATRIAYLSESEFRAQVDALVGAGLFELPVEVPRDCEDVYERRVRIELHDRGRSWRNGTRGGCVESPSTQRPTKEQQATFDGLVARLRAFAVARATDEGTRSDEAMVVIEDPADARLFRAVVDALKSTQDGPELDFNRAELAIACGGAPRTCCIPWRATQCARFGGPTWPGGYVVELDPGTAQVKVVSSVRPASANAEARARRSAFVTEHPELSARDARLVRSGWIDAGMSEAAIVAAWGPPQGREEHVDCVVLRYHGDPQVTDLVLRAGRLVHRFR